MADRLTMLWNRSLLCMRRCDKISQQVWIRIKIKTCSSQIPRKSFSKIAQLFRCIVLRFSADKKFLDKAPEVLGLKLSPLRLYFKSYGQTDFMSSVFWLLLLTFCFSFNLFSLSRSSRVSSHLYHFYM